MKGLPSSRFSRPAPPAAERHDVSERKEDIFMMIHMRKSAFNGIILILMIFVQSCSKSPIIPAKPEPSPVLIAPAMFQHKNSAPGLQGYYDEMDLLINNGMNLWGWAVEDWKDLEPSTETYNLQDYLINPLTLLVPKYPQLKGVVFVLKMIDTNVRKMPTDIETKPFDDPEVIQRFEKLIDAIAAEPSTKRITHILLGNEVNGYLSRHPEELDAFSTFYQRAVNRIHTKMPGVRVSTILTFDVFGHPDVFDELSRHSDFITYTYYPIAHNPGIPWQMLPVSELKAAIDVMAARAGNKQFAFTEIGYSSSPLNGSSEEQQAEFVREMFRVLDTYQEKGQIVFLLYHALYDYEPSVCGPYAEEQGVDPTEICAFMNNLGLRSWETGKPRKAWNVFVQGVQSWLSD